MRKDKGEAPPRCVEWMGTMGTEEILAVPEADEGEDAPDVRVVFPLTLTLLKPLIVKSKAGEELERVEALTFTREPNAGDLIAAGKAEALALSIKVGGRMAGLRPSLVERLGIRDTMAVTRIVGLFF